MTWRRRMRIDPDLLVDRREEADEAVAESVRELAEAREQSARLARIADALRREGHVNHFAERVAEAYRRRSA